MLTSQAPHGDKCDMWQQMEQQDETANCAHAGSRTELCHRCQMAVSYGMAPLCDPDKENRFANFLG